MKGGSGNGNCIIRLLSISREVKHFDKRRFCLDVLQKYVCFGQDHVANLNNSHTDLDFFHVSTLLKVFVHGFSL